MSDKTRSYLVDKVLREQAKDEEKEKEKEKEKGSQFPSGEGLEATPVSVASGQVGSEGAHEPEVSMEELLDSFSEVREGDILRGTIVQVRRDGVLVDVDRKAEGFIPVEEWGGDLMSEAKVGDEVEVYVLRVEDDVEEAEEKGENFLKVSKRRADYERAWREVEEAQRTGEILQALVKDRVKGGLIVDLGVDGFVPASQVLAGKNRSIERFVGRTLKVKILEVDRKTSRVVCSNKLAIEEERVRMREEALARIREGKVFEGTVKRLADFGAFIDLGGVEGLLHVSEMSWSRVEHPSNVLKVGQRVHVVVLRYDPQTQRISLGMKQLLPDPWKTAERDYPVGTRVHGKVSRIVQSGAFVRLPPPAEGVEGIEGIIPINEVSERRAGSISDILSVGDEVVAKVIQVNRHQRRLMLSLRQVAQDQERQVTHDYMRNQAPPQVTIGDVVGNQLDRLSSIARREEDTDKENKENKENKE